MFSRPEGMPGWECFLPHGLSNWFVRGPSGNVFYLLSLACDCRASLFSAFEGCPQKPSRLLPCIHFLRVWRRNPNAQSKQRRKKIWEECGEREGSQCQSALKQEKQMISWISAVKTRLCSVWFAKIIITGFHAATDIAPASPQGTRNQEGCAVPMDAGHGGEQPQGELEGCCPSPCSSKSGEESAHNSFSHVLECLASSLTSPICFPVSVFNFSFFHGQFWGMKFAELK